MASAADLQPTSTSQHGAAAPVACPSHLILLPARWCCMLGSHLIQPARILRSLVHCPLTHTSHPQPHLLHVAHLHARGGCQLAAGQQTFGSHIYFVLWPHPSPSAAAPAACGSSPCPWRPPSWCC